jgi:hypothetical protein
MMLTGGVCFGFHDEGFQYWSTASLNVDIDKDWKLTVDEEFRLGDDGGNFYYQHTDVGLVYKNVTDWMDLGINYRQVNEKDSRDVWRQENRPHLNVTLKGKIHDIDFSSRSRFEFRNLEKKKDLWRYRNKFTCKLPLELTAVKLKPYVADEVFVDFDQKGLNRNRLYAGFSVKLAKQIKGGIYYLWQTSRSKGEWQDIHALGTQLKFTF